MKTSILLGMLAAFLLTGFAASAETNPHGQNAEKFRNNAAARQAIDFEKIDQDLLAAAVFHETNRRRTAQGQPALIYQQSLREAARIQSLAMRSEGAISHKHPEKQKRTLSDRMDFVGLKGRFSAENVAMVFGTQYKSGQRFYIREGNGRRVLSHAPNGPPIPPHNYLSFAVSLLDSWMGSPGHRKNILSREAQYLGTESLHARGDDGMDRFYCTQVFFTPLGG